MAEGGPRRAGPVWAWLLGLIVLVLLIWFVTTGAAAPPTATEAPAEVLTDPDPDDVIRSTRPGTEPSPGPRAGWAGLIPDRDSRYVTSHFHRERRLPTRPRIGGIS